MNDIDFTIMRGLQNHRRLQGKYPAQVIVTDELKGRMSCQWFYFLELPEPETATITDLTPLSAPDIYDSRVSVEVISESEYAMEQRMQRAAAVLQRGAVHSQNLWDF